MDRFERRGLIVPGLALAAGLALAGCNYSSSGPPPQFASRPTPEGPAPAPTGADAPAPAANEAGEGSGGPAANVADGPEPIRSDEEKTAILNNVVRLISTAGTQPGGRNFDIAIRNLNQYFAGTPEGEYALAAPARDFLEETLPKKDVDALEVPTWTRSSARHVEDCMLYHGIASRVAGLGDDLTRARRVFEWMVEQVQLVPAGSLGAPGLGQAYARPFDVLLRGMATESKGFWSERGWLFLALCRQLGLDGGLVTYTAPDAKAPVVWCCAILIDGKPGENGGEGDAPGLRAYLFDPRVGLPVPGPGGRGIATIDDAMNDPEVLARMDLPGQFPYNTTARVLRDSPSKVGILLDSSLNYFSPRMRLLQERLAGKDLTVLYRDPAAQRDRWAQALGPRLGKVGLWELPMTTEALLFSNPQFVESTLASLLLFRPEFPLLYARMKQLRGETTDAVQDYVSMRFAEHPTLMDRKTPMPPEVQQAIDVYATYFLGMCHLDQKDPQKAGFFFERTLRMLPEYGPGQPFYTMFRWGAQANLGRLREAKGATSEAIAYYSQKDLTTQHHGNLLRARALVWLDPTAPSPAPLPPPPAPAAPPAAAAATPRGGEVRVK